MARRRPALTLLLTGALAAVLALTAGCGGDEAPPGAGTPTSTLPPATTDWTLRTLIDEPVEPGPIYVRGDRLGETTPFRRLDVTFPSGDLTISGIVSLPAGDGPFPVVVAVHGYQPPAEYQPSSSMLGEQTALVAAGYAVLAVDLRGYARSDADPSRMPDQEVGATQDVVAAVGAIAAGGVPQLDPHRVALLGHSQGGRIALNAAVVAPDAIKAVVVTSPSSARAWENVQYFHTALLGADGALGTRGTPQTQPAFWADVTTTTFADRATHLPVLVLQGDADEVVAPAWATATVDAWRAAGGDATLVMLPGANHALEPVFDDAMRQSVEFLAAHV